MTTPAALPPHDVTDLGLAAEGVRRIEWAEREMPVLRLIRARFEREQPLKGIRIAACLHVTTETANLARTLVAGGAELVLAASNPLSTRDDVAAALTARYGIGVFARHGEDRDTYYAHLNQVADTRPQVTMDDGCDLVSLLHSDRRDLLSGVLAGTEETTTGVIRLRAMAAAGALEFPGRGGQRGRDQAPVRQPLRNRPEHGRRHPAGHQHPARRAARRGGRVRLGREGDRAAPQGHGRPRRGRRGEPGPRARGADGRLRGQDRRPGGTLGRAVHHRDGQQERVPARAVRGHAGRRDHGQQRPLRRRARPRRARARWPRATSARSARTSRSSTSGRGSSTSSPRAGS